MTELVSYELKDGVATIAISNGKANALSQEVFEGLNAALDRAEQGKAVEGVELLLHEGWGQ